ncbi:MAG: hypothetical protein NTY88_11355 [Bacteroidetes bacterium]|nr:hypothetical protein [Bacteroidota bacterium]
MKYILILLVLIAGCSKNEETSTANATANLGDWVLTTTLQNQSPLVEHITFTTANQVVGGGWWYTQGVTFNMGRNNITYRGGLGASGGAGVTTPQQGTWTLFR